MIHKALLTIIIATSLILFATFSIAQEVHDDIVLKGVYQFDCEKPMLIGCSQYYLNKGKFKSKHCTDIPPCETNKGTYTIDYKKKMIIFYDENKKKIHSFELIYLNGRWEFEGYKYKKKGFFLIPR